MPPARASASERRARRATSRKSKAPAAWNRSGATQQKGYMMTDRTALIAGYRRAADLIEAHPDLAAPHVGSDGELRWNLYSWDCPDGIPAMVAAIRRTIGGKWTKREVTYTYSGPEMVFEREGYSITVKREAVCVRRVVGTETVTLPAVTAQPERTEEREIVEWDCEPVLAAEAAVSR